jgi:hypothetical protein
MNRFDDSFHGIDPATGRPFSSGHPDGVWIVAIVYSLVVLGALAGLILPFIFSEKAPPITLAALGPVAISAALLVPPVVFLFRRSTAAVFWLLGLAVLACVGAILVVLKLRAGEVDYTALIGPVVLIAAQSYIAFFAYRLRRDQLLK